MKPSRKNSIYNQQINGVFGEIGGAGNARLMYVQTALSFDDLKLITLVADIKGSEKWPVRELFQREVDHERVKKDLVPYFTSKDKIKFFNPITLVLLPLGDDGKVISENKFLQKKRIQEANDEYFSYENDEYYRFMEFADNPAFSFVEWNDKKVKLVAIDGQHRVSALKVLAEDAISRGIGDWKIPVIIACPKKFQENVASDPILTIVRSIFVYINNNAQAINLSRGVLLDDHQLWSVVTQELIQACHDNDLSQVKNPSIPPLLFFDWRGLEEKGEKNESLTSVLTTIEICRLFESYMFPEDYDFTRARNFLNAEDNEIKVSRPMETTDTKKVREIIKIEIIPSVLHLINDFAPFRDYCIGLRKIVETQDPYKKKIVEEIRFGSRDYLPSEKVSLDNARTALTSEINKLKDSLPRLFQNSIAFRGVFSSFCDIKYSLTHENEGISLDLSWSDYTKSFMNALNDIYSKNLLSLDPKKSAELLRHIVIDDFDKIIYYRYEDAAQSLGKYISILILKRLTIDGFDDDFREELLEDYLQVLKEKMKRSVRKRFRAELKEKNRSWSKARLDNESNDLASDYVDKKCKHIIKL